MQCEKLRAAVDPEASCIKPKASHANRKLPGRTPVNYRHLETMLTLPDGSNEVTDNQRNWQVAMHEKVNICDNVATHDHDHSS